MSVVRFCLARCENGSPLFYLFHTAPAAFAGIIQRFFPVKRHLQFPLQPQATYSSFFRISRQGLYQALSENGNPRFSTISQILDALGLQLAVTRKDAA